MNANSLFLLSALATTVLVACSSGGVKPDPTTALPKAVTPKAPVLDEAIAMQGLQPEMTVSKEGKTLNLVRIMDGAVCKNDHEGVKGVFLLYANPEDMERIKRDKGVKVFSEFETQIQNLAAQALTLAVEQTNLAEDPFALDAEQAQRKLALQLQDNFKQATQPLVTAFEKASTLTINVAPFKPSLTFYQHGCNTKQMESELAN